MKKYSDDETIAQLLIKSREDAGLSQGEVAKRMDVSKRTVQNWESCVSSPSPSMIVAWFSAIHKQLLPYLLQATYGGESLDDLTDEQLDNTVFHFVKSLPRRSKEEIAYLAYGDHGTAPLAFFELAMAYVQTSLRDRVMAAQLIKANYELSKAFDTVSDPNQIQPDLDVIDEFIDAAKKTIKDKLSRR